MSPKFAIYTLPLLISIVSCGGGGGGGGSGGSGGDTAAPEAAPSEQDPTSQSSYPESDTIDVSEVVEEPKENTTKLADNPIDSTQEITVFDGYSLKVNMDTIELSGQERFIKVVEQSGATLFLGKIHNSGTVTLPFHLKPSAFPLHISFFSESPSDQIINRMIDHESI